MKQIIYHIRYLTLVIALVVFTVATAMAQKPVPYFEIMRCDTIQFMIDEMPGDEYTWDLYQDSTENFAVNKGDMEPVIYFEDGMYRGAIVRVLDLPIGAYFLRIMAWDEVNCTNNLMVFQLNVIDPPPPELIGDSVCVDDVPLVKIIFTGSGPWDFEYAFDDGFNTINLNGHTDDPEITIPIMHPFPVGEHKIWIMEVTDACTVNTYEVDKRPAGRILIYPKPRRSKIYVKDN